MKITKHIWDNLIDKGGICDVSNNQGEITPIRSDQIPSTEM